MNKLPFEYKQYKYITDNTSLLDDETILLKTAQNTQYIPKNIGETITPGVLIKFLNLEGIKIVGITGTNGKTSTAAMIYSLLIDMGESVAMQGTRGFFINSKTVESKSLTTPNIFNTIKHLLKAKNHKCKYFIMEVSSHAIHQERIEGLNFDLKILTNITGDHLDYHKTFEEYKRVKESFFQDSTPKLINKDTININFNIKNAYTYSLDLPATYKIDAYTLNDGISALISHIKESASFESNLCGLFNVYNLLASVSAIHILSKQPLVDICKHIPNFLGVSGRAEVVHLHPTVVIDFAHTADGIANILESFKNPNLIVVFGAGGDRDKSKRPIMGQIVQKYAKEIIITNDNPRSEDPMDIVSDIIIDMPDDTRAMVILERDQAIQKALSMASEDDIVCILGKGDETYIEIKDKKLPHSDKESVLRYYSQI